MPLQTDYPTGITSSDWGLEGAPSALAAVASNDGDTSFIYADSGGAMRTVLFTFPSMVGVVSPVTAAAIYGRVRQYAPGAGGHGFSFLWNSVSSGVNLAPDIRAVAPAWTLQSYSAAAGGLLLAAVNGSHGFQMTAAGGPSNKWEVWCTECYRLVDFLYNSGSADNFAHLIGSVAAAIGANLLMRDMATLSSFIHKRTRTLIKPSEYAEALGAWRRERHVCIAGV